MSPRELSRTTRNRCSAMRRPADGFEKIARRVILGVIHNGYAHDSAGGSGGFTADSIEKFFTRDGGRAVFHHHEASGDVGDVCSFERRGPASECESVCGKNRVARAGDVDGFIATVHGNLSELILRIKKSHAMPPAGDEKRLKLHGCECCAARTGELFNVLAYRRVMLCLDLGFVWSSRRDASFRIRVKLIASVKRDGQIILAFPGGLLD